MSKGLVKIPMSLSDSDPDKSIWEKNPQLKYYSPYGDLYDADTSKDKMFSSRQMWCIVFYNDPDEERNIFFRGSPAERKEKILERYGKDIDWEDYLFQRCLKAYPEDCMTIVERALAMEKDKLMQRAELIRNTDLTLDETDPVTGKVIKGTALQIAALQNSAAKAYESYKNVEDLFREEREAVRAYGGGTIPVADRTKGFW